MPKDITSQAQFEACVGEWKNMDRSTDTNRKTASEFYDKEVFPTVIDVFVNRYRSEKAYEGLLLTLGFHRIP